MKRLFLLSLLIVFAVVLIMFRKGVGMPYGNAMSIAQRCFSNPQLLEAAKAITDNDMALINTMKRSGFNINEQEAPSPIREGIYTRNNLLTWAVVTRNETLVNRVLDAGADPNYVLAGTNTALAWAASLEDPSMMLLLLRRGANPNVLSEDKIPPMFEARSSGRWNNVFLLLDHGADVNAIDKRTGDTLAMYAIAGDADQVVKLLQRGLDPTHLDYQGAGLAHELKWDGANPGLPNEKYRQQVREMLKERGVQLEVPKFGPPPRDQWPAGQKNDPHLFDAEEEARKYGFR